MKLKNLKVIFIAIVLTLGGLAVGQLFKRPLLGIAVGAAAGIPLAMFITTTRRRWISIALLNVEFILCYLVGGWGGVLLALTASGLTFFTSAAILRELYGGDEFEAFRHHLNLAFGVLRGFQIVDQGKTMTPSGSGQLLGPRFVVVRPGNAVVTERVTHLKSYGPGTFVSAPFEYVKHVYDLQEKQISLTLDDVMTFDPIPTVVKAFVSYALDISNAARIDARPLGDDEKDLLINIPFTIPQWESATRAAIEQSLRQTIRARSMEELLTDVNYDDLEEEVRRLADNRVKLWHVRLGQVVIESVQPKTESASAMDGRYRERIRAQGLKEALTLLAQGYRQAKRFGLSESEIYRETVRRTLEAMSKDPSTKFVFGPELNELLGEIGAI